MLSKQKVLESIKHVVDNSTYVSIDQEALERVVKNFQPTQTIHWSDVYPLNYQPRKNPSDEIDYLFLLGNQAFCYWGYPTKWTIDYRSQKLDGWFGQIAAFDRALENGLNILDGEFLANLTLEKTRQIYEGEPEIPLLAARFEMMKKIGEVLVEKYNGRFHNFFEVHKASAFELVENLAAEFAGFDDAPIYKGKEVLFYKKAQLVATDISTVEKLGGLDDLTGMADYKVPAIFREKGILVYNSQLAEKVDNRIELPEASEMEIEIRANMHWASEQIVEKLKERGIKVNNVDLQNILWIESQDKAKLTKPYHLTKTVFY